MDDLTKSLIREYVTAEVRRQLSDLPSHPTPGPAGPTGRRGTPGSTADTEPLTRRIDALETALGITSTEETP